MATQPVVVGGTYDWYLNPASINTEAAPGVFGAWDLTGATVTISFIPPSGAGQHFTATIVTASSGIARYINLTTLFNVAGEWGYSWKVVSSTGVVLESEIMYFTVKASGAAQ